MFGFGRRSEMKEIQSRTESCVRKIERYLEDIKDTLNETIRIAKESELPENNVINQKEYLFLDLGKAQEYFNKINAKLKVEGLYIPDEIAIKDLKIGISECEKMVYSLKNMDIPTSENIEDYFREYSENYNTAIASASLAAGVGVLGIGGAALGTSLTLAGFSTAGIVGTSLMGAGSLLGGIGAIAAGPIGWIIGGIGLLGFLGSAPSKEEIIEAREQLYEIQKKRDEIYEVYMATLENVAKAKGVIRLSQNFTEIRKELSLLFEDKTNIMRELVDKNLEENKIKLKEELIPIINENINKLLTYLYVNYREKKKFFCFRRKKTIWNMIENAENVEIAFNLLNKYLRVPKEYKNITRDLDLLLSSTDLEKIEVLEVFDRKDSYFIFQDRLNNYIQEIIEKNVRITSLEAKEAMKEVIDLMKLLKNIIITPMINIDATELEKVEGLDDVVSNLELDYYY